jgi:hypothetical protein
MIGFSVLRMLGRKDLGVDVDIRVHDMRYNAAVVASRGPRIPAWSVCISPRCV